MQTLTAILTLFFGFCAVTQASQTIDFTFESDSSREMILAMLYREPLDVGTNFKLRYHVEVPEFGQAPLKSNANRVEFSFDQKHGKQVQGSWVFGDTFVAAANDSQKTHIFKISNEFAIQNINVMHLMLKALPDPLPTHSLWKRQAGCSKDGVKCYQIYTLFTRELPHDEPEGLPQMMCYRITELVKPSHIKLHPKAGQSEDAYLDDLIYQQTAALERGMSENTCTLFAL